MDQNAVNQREWELARNWGGWLGLYRYLGGRDTRLWDRYAAQNADFVPVVPRIAVLGAPKARQADTGNQSRTSPPQLPGHQGRVLDWVPRRNAAHGWTLNFAYGAAWWTLLGLLSVPMGLVLLLVVHGAARGSW